MVKFTKRFSMRVTEKMHEDIKKLADALDFDSMQAYIRQTVKKENAKWLAKLENKDFFNEKK